MRKTTDRFNFTKKTLDSSYGLLAAAVVNTNAAISRHYASQPKPEDFATDHELATWQMQLQGLTASRDNQ
jgi:hypothetical protein